MDEDDFFNSDEKCDYLSKMILDEWEVEKGEKIVIMLAKQEISLCISCSSGLRRILTSERIGNISEQMTTAFLWRWNQQPDLVNAILFCLGSIDEYLTLGCPDFLEQFGWVILWFGIVVLYNSQCFQESHQDEYEVEQDLRKKRKTRKMNEQEYSEAMALMDRYQCHLCPICLEDYTVSDGLSSTVEDVEKNETEKNYNSFSNQQYCGCDGAPIHLLRCGHSTCQECWTVWIQTGKSSGLCPVCKENILFYVDDPLWKPE